jgi:hypothetical protein
MRANHHIKSERGMDDIGCAQVSLLLPWAGRHASKLTIISRIADAVSESRMTTVHCFSCK